MKNLPAIKTVLQAIGYVVRNFGTLLKTCMAWVAIYAAFNLFTYFSGVAEYLEIGDRLLYLKSLTKLDVPEINLLNIQLDEQARGLGSLIGFNNIVGKIIQFMAIAAVSVAWIRFNLLAEKPPLLRFGALEIKFSLYLGAFAAANGFYVWLIYRIFDDISTAMLGIAVIIGVFLFILFTSRMLLVLPGVAVGDKRMTPAYAWQLTKRNSWDIYGGIMLVFLAWIPVFILKVIFDDFGLPIFIDWPGHLQLNLVWQLLLVSYISICYQFFVPRPEAGDLD